MHLSKWSEPLTVPLLNYDQALDSAPWADDDNSQINTDDDDSHNKKITGETPEVRSDKRKPG